MNPKPRLILFIFVIQILLNWWYVLWVSHQPNIIINAWFALIPFFGFLYFALALYAFFSMYYRLKLGLGLAIAVIFFGTTLSVISYELAFQYHDAVNALIAPLIILNFCVIFFMAYNKKYFKTN